MTAAECRWCRYSTGHTSWCPIVVNAPKGTKQCRECQSVVKVSRDGRALAHSKASGYLCRGTGR